MFSFRKLSPEVAVRDWAAKLVAAQGDACFELGQFAPGICALPCSPDCRPTVAFEEVSKEYGGVSTVVKQISVARYLDDVFAAPFWDEPRRTRGDIPRHRDGFLMPRVQHNSISLPEPVVTPIVVRVMRWQGGKSGSGLPSGRSVQYTLYELR